MTTHKELVENARLALSAVHDDNSVMLDERLQSLSKLEEHASTLADDIGEEISIEIGED